MDKLFEEFKAVRNKSVSVGKIPENKEGFRVEPATCNTLSKVGSLLKQVLSSKDWTYDRMSSANCLNVFLHPIVRTLNQELLGKQLCKIVKLLHVILLFSYIQWLHNTFVKLLARKVRRFFQDTTLPTLQRFPRHNRWIHTDLKWRHAFTAWDSRKDQVQMDLTPSSFNL